MRRGSALARTSSAILARLLVAARRRYFASNSGHSKRCGPACLRPHKTRLHVCRNAPSMPAKSGAFRRLSGLSRLSRLAVRMSSIVERKWLPGRRIPNVRPRHLNDAVSLTIHRRSRSRAGPSRTVGVNRWRLTRTSSTTADRQSVRARVDRMRASMDRSSRRSSVSIAACGSASCGSFIAAMPAP